MNPYYVIYENYSEYNQFEGSWDKDWTSFSSFADAVRFIEDIKDNGNYRDVIGPLVKEYDS